MSIETDTTTELDDSSDTTVDALADACCDAPADVGTPVDTLYTPSLHTLSREKRKNEVDKAGIQSLLREWLVSHPDDAQRIVRELIRLATDKKNVASTRLMAINAIFDRVDGKPTEHIQQDVGTTITLVFRSASTGAVIDSTARVLPDGNGQSVQPGSHTLQLPSNGGTNETG